MTNHSTNDTARSPREHVTAAASAASRMATEKAEAVTDDLTAQAHDTAQRAANAATAASAELEPGTVQSQVADQIAAGLHQVAGELKEYDLDRIVGQTTRFARENPALFLGGAAFLGFAAARFLRASAQEQDAPAPVTSTDPWSGHVTSTPTPAIVDPQVSS